MKTTIIRKGIVLSVLAALVFLLCVIYIGGNFVAQAASYSESESNNSKDTANQIAVNTSVSGNLSTSSDVDWYKFTTTQDGYFNVEFTHTFLSSSSKYWCIWIYNETGVNGITGQNDYFTATGNANALSTKYGVPAGTYYVIVGKYSKYDYSANKYMLNVNFTVASDWETENNNNKDYADNMNVNQDINGALSTSSDVDWYSFEIKQRGYLQVSFEHIFLSSPVDYWQVNLYDTSGVNLLIDGSYISIPGNENVSSRNYGVSPGKYYIAVKSKRYDYSGNDYSLKVNFTVASDWEMENNNSKNSASEVKVNEAINGAISTSDDVDWYRFSISSTSQIALVFNHEVVDSSIALWHIYLYDNTGVTLLNKFSVNGNEASRASDYISVSSETCYIKITPRYYYTATDYSGVDYSLCVVEKHEHVGTWSTAKPATCLEGGTVNRTCTICGVIETQETEPLGHDYVGVQTKEATITQKGETTFTCSRCGDSYTESDGSKLWVIPVICIVGVLVLIGVINYIRIVRKRP